MNRRGDSREPKSGKRISINFPSIAIVPAHWVSYNCYGLNKRIEPMAQQAPLDNLRGRVKFPIGGMARGGRARDPDGGFRKAALPG